MEIIYEDNHLIVISKPFCMPSQGDISGDESVVDWVKQYIKVTYNKPGNVYLALLHRLDRPVGGVMVLAKTSKAAARMSKQFQKKQIEKVYHAVVLGNPHPQSGELVHYLRKIPGKNITRAYKKEVADSKLARLSYTVLRKGRNKRSLVEVLPITGRQHQIRVQLAKIGCSIVGDVKYGAARFLPDKSIALFAKRITFRHPTTREWTTFEAPKDSLKEML